LKGGFFFWVRPRRGRGSDENQG